MPLSAVNLAYRYDPSSELLFANMTVGPNDQRRRDIDKLIRALKVAGIWPKLDVLYLFAAHTETAALLNWKAPGTFTGTNVSGTAFAIDRGFTGDGSADHINSNFTPSTAGGLYAQDSAHHAAWSLTAGAASSSQRLIGAAGATTPRAVLIPRNASDQMNIIINDATGDVGANAVQSGHFLANRSASNATQSYKDGVSIDTSAVNSTGLPTQAICFDRDNATFSTLQIAGGSIGASLTAADVLALYAAKLSYLQAVGAV
jgi:hypothetical protein